MRSGGVGTFMTARRVEGRMGLRVVDRLNEALTDPRLEPHFFLAGLLALTALVAIVLFVLDPVL